MPMVCFNKAVWRFLSGPDVHRSGCERPGLVDSGLSRGSAKNGTLGSLLPQMWNGNFRQKRTASFKDQHANSYLRAFETPSLPARTQPGFLSPPLGQELISVRAAAGDVQDVAVRVLEPNDAERPANVNALNHFVETFWIFIEHHTFSA